MRKAAFLLVVGLGLSSMAVAAPSFCLTTAKGAALSTLTMGCQSSDLVFSNFTVGVDSGNSLTGYSAPTIDDINLYATNDPSSVTAFFNTQDSTNTWSVTMIGDQMQSILSYTVDSTNGITGLDLPSAGISFSGTAPTSITITETYCLGQATVTVGCTGGGLNVVIFGGSIFTPATPATFASTNEIAIQDEITINNGYALLTLPNEFDTVGTPEPSTLMLSGLAFAGLLLLRRYRRAS